MIAPSRMNRVSVLILTASIVISPLELIRSWKAIPVPDINSLFFIALLTDHGQVTLLIGAERPFPHFYGARWICAAAHPAKPPRIHLNH
jgi:hypothetical protein